MRSFLAFILVFASLQAAIIDSFKGDVRVKLAKGTLGPAAKGAIITSGDMVITGANGEAQISLNDKTIVQVAANSRYQLTEDASRNSPGKSMVVSGKTSFDFSKLKKPGAGDSAKVYTPTAVCGIRGTKIEVFVNDNGASQTSVTEGTVSASSDTVGDDGDVSKGQPVTVGEGYSADKAGAEKKKGMKLPDRKAMTKRPAPGSAALSPEYEAHYSSIMDALSLKIKEFYADYKTNSAQRFQAEAELKALQAAGKNEEAVQKLRQAASKKDTAFIAYKNAMARIYQYQGYNELMAKNKAPASAGEVAAMFDDMKVKLTEVNK